MRPVLPHWRLIRKQIIQDIKRAEPHQRIPRIGIIEPISVDREAHLADVALALFQAAAEEQALVVVGDDVVREGDVVGAVFAVHQAVVPVDAVAPD